MRWKRTKVKTPRKSMLSFDGILKALKEKSRPEQIEAMSRFGIRGTKRLGVSVPDLRKLARRIGRDHNLALRLWETGIEDARILASMIDEPQQVDEKQMEAWAADFDSWDVCDQVCMNLFDRVQYTQKKIRQWAQREEEFVRRAAFALIAIVCVHDKQTRDEDFISFFPLIKQGALDDRNYVKKAVSWALRNLGKRALTLHQEACNIARELQQKDSRSARWIASDALKELRGEKVLRNLERKSASQSL